MNKRKVLGRVLRQFRSNAKLTQEQVAEATKGLVEQPAVSKIEKGSQGIDRASEVHLQSRIDEPGHSMTLWIAKSYYYTYAMGKPDPSPEALQLQRFPFGGNIAD